MKWRKVPHFPKWAGYIDGKHVVTLAGEGADRRVWVDGGDGFRECIEIQIRPHALSQWKLFCELAHHFLVKQLENGVTQ